MGDGEMKETAFETIEHQVAVIAEAVEQGECFYTVEKLDEVMDSIEDLKNMILLKFNSQMEYGEEEIKVQLERLLGSKNEAVKVIARNAIEFMEGEFVKGERK